MSRNVTLVVAGLVIAVLVTASAPSAWAQAVKTNDPCSLLTRAQIAKATGIQVAKGEKGAPIPGAIGSCWWVASDGTRIVVTIADASHMQVTMQSQVQAGAAKLPGLGLSAVATKGNAETEGGYNISVLDRKGGVAVSILGAAGTSDRTVALAKLIETHR
jgi:hypothetical protein